MTSQNETVPAEVRRDRILGMLQDQEYVRIAQLAEEFGVSVVTVRADLDLLSDQGLIRRVRGGARQRPPEVDAEVSYEMSLGAAPLEKAAIAKAAAALVTSGESVIIDSGTTTTFLTRALVARTDLTDLVIFTNSLAIAHELEPAIPRFSVVVTGGTLRPAQHSLVDPLAGRILEDIRVDTLFFGCNGLHPQSGATSTNLHDAEVKQRMLRAAGRSFLLADSSKLGRVALVPICRIEQIDELITGEAAEPATVAALRAQGMSVTVAGGHS